MEQLQETEESYYKVAIDKAWEDFYADNLDSAKEICEKLILEYPEKVYPHYLLGHVYLSQKKYQEAADEILISDANDNERINSGWAYYWLGEIYSASSFFGNEGVAYINDPEKADYYYNQARKAKTYPIQTLLRQKYKLKGQKKIELLEEGVAKFPDETIFYILLAQHYKSHGMAQRELNSLKTALDKGLSSASLSYNLGKHFYAKKDFASAQLYFQETLVKNKEFPKDNFGPGYMLGRSFEESGSTEKAIQAFKNTYEESINTHDSLFGFFGLLNVLLTIGDKSSIKELVLNLNIHKDLIADGGRLTGGPLKLAIHVDDDIQMDNMLSIYRNLTKLKLDKRDDDIFNGKIWLLRYFLAKELSKINDQYKAIKNASQLLNRFHYDFITGFFADTLTNYFYEDEEVISDLDKTYQMLMTDLEEDYALRNHLAHHIQKLFELFFEAKAWQKVIDLSGYFTLEQIAEEDSLFELAYSYAELKDEKNAQIIYQKYLDHEGDNSAVLNNLGNIFKNQKKYDDAIALYRRGLVVNPKDETLKRNLENTLKEKAKNERLEAEDKSQQLEYRSAIKSLAFENDYVIEKLTQFLEQIKKDESFKNWKVAVPKYKFQKFAGVDKQRAESLVNQWIDKGYLKLTTERAAFSVSVYQINPFIEQELKRIVKRKIPQQWIDGFISISIDSLEQNGYFDMTERIAKVTKKFRTFFERDFNELIHNYLLGHFKSSVILSGSLVELALIYFCERKKLNSITFQDVNGKQKTKKIYDCVLIDLISYVEQNKLFGSDVIHLSNLSRIYRNFVHPGKELKEMLDKSKADLCFISTVEILKKII
ncbi:lipopolysaccharide assembly protein LapB [Pedobacter sp. BMA]|uniref:tetratricopeptide repeat protein n=1 Tax=Pedobacter sp. BMA TaxID=1663685 RepID=UPI000649934C|nr:tetratricopeptide repeat protein [Pedobacter sp. BMA]KLT63928.1 hypothetical protein AB669_19560 [Pedobacter sp. BMA]